ncbi:Ubiquitin-like domain-containing protein [Pleurotus pulmonarius]
MLIRIQHEMANSSQVYPVTPTESVEALKALIEDTEGIPTEQQTLTFDGTPLSTLRSLSEEDTVVLSFLPTITLRLDDGSCREFPIHLESTVDELLDRVCQAEGGLWLSRRDLRLALGQRLLLGETSLSSNGVAQGSELVLSANDSLQEAQLDTNIINTTNAVDGEEEGPPRKKTKRRTPAAVVRAYFDWDGDMKHPMVQGLPLHQGSFISVFDMTTPDWCYGQCGDDEGHFPRQYVKLMDIFTPRFERQMGADDPILKGLSLPQAKSTRRISPFTSFLMFGFIPPSQHGLDRPPVSPPRPPLPPFSYPREPPIPLLVRLGDEGRSFSRIQMTFPNHNIVPGARIPVDLRVECCPIPPRRITSIMIVLSFPGNDIGDINPTLLLGPQTRANETEFWEKQVLTAKADDLANPTNFGIHLIHDWEEKLAAMRTTRMVVQGTSVGGDTALWMLTEDAGKGLPIEMTMSLSLRHRPRRLEYSCIVTHALREKTKRDRIDGDQMLYTT